MLHHITPPQRSIPPAVIALAASAGGVEALTTVIAGLPHDLRAAVLVVLHIAPAGPSLLPEIIERHSDLRCDHASDKEALEAGRVYAAPPDRHLVVADGRIRVMRGPRENGNRPAADPLFRSVAAAYGPRAVGVVLSGSLDDGTAGLVAIREAGGLTVVQDPDEAAFPGMPQNAVAHASPAVVARLEEIPAILTRFVEGVPDMPLDDDAGKDREGALAESTDDRPSEFTCPECGGTLWAVGDEPLRLRCRVSHSFSEESFVLGKRVAVESALWAAVVALEERADLARRILRRVGAGRAGRLARQYERQIEQSEAGASTLRRFAAELIDDMAHAEAAGDEAADG